MAGDLEKDIAKEEIYHFLKISKEIGCFFIISKPVLHKAIEFTLFIKTESNAKLIRI